MKDIITRALTGIVFVAVVVAAICLHPFSFVALFTLVVGIAIWEFYSIDKENKSWRKVIGIVAGMYLFMATFLYAGGFVSIRIMYPYIVFLLGVLVSSLYHLTSNPVKNCAMSLFGQFYIAGLLSTLNFIVFDPVTKQFFPYYALLIFIFVWLNDTGAYLSGITLGKHRLFQRISPLKSWEGFVGGLILTICFSIGIACYFPEILTWYHSVAMAIVTVVFATYGDLVESLLKRTGEVKDSGILLPGHGGILDRFDSVIMATPAVLLYIELFIRN